MRLTVELVQNSLSFLNPLKERELDLRGHKIPAIENLGVARDQDAIDFTDNDITVLGNFPFSPRLRTLLLARNRITSIQQTLPNNIPNLVALTLTANNIAELADLEILSRFSRLTHLSVMENPVARKEHYRYWLIHLCPTVRFLDYAKVKDAERTQAASLFGASPTSPPTPLKSKILNVKSSASRGGAGGNTFDVPSDPSATAAATDAGPAKSAFRVKLTDKEKKRVEAMIRNAKSLQEIARLEKELAEGRVPGGIGGADDGDEMEE